MDSDTLFTVVWASISILIGVIGGIYIYKYAKALEDRKNSIEELNAKNRKEK